jgi:DNA ligase-1
MPKSVKPAPPQQSSLAEMWGGKKQPKNTPADAPNAPDTQMDVDPEEPPKPAPLSRVESDAPESSKRKEIAPGTTPHVSQ